MIYTGKKIAPEKKWVIDGNYSWIRPEFLPYCDLVVILRPPLIINLWRLWWRGFFRRFDRPLIEITRNPINVVNTNPPEGLLSSFYILADHAIKYYKSFAKKKFLEAKKRGIKVIVISSSQTDKIINKIFLKKKKKKTIKLQFWNFFHLHFIILEPY